MSKERNGFGVRLKKLRKNAGMTQNQLADKLNKSGSAVRMWELGSNEPDINTLVEISSIFDCSLDYLMCRDALLGKEGAVRTNIPVYRLSEYENGGEPDYYKSILPEYLDTGFTYIMLKNDARGLAPLIPAGALVLIRLQPSCLHGQTVLFKLHGKIYLKKISYYDGGMIFTGSFPDSEPIIADSSEDDLEIFGVAVEYSLNL
ncbi:MAG: LexA family transcriptional regulator [Oscillospiraceae bacterium]|nr:LexA family transcriptional regulator [Oscillospiraceae bacterium]